MASLETLCHAAFKGVNKFYRARRGTGETALDVSTFFQRKALHRDFERFWKRESGSHKTLYSGALNTFKEHMREVAEER